MTFTGQEKSGMFRNRLQKVFRHLSKQARRQGISCYRVYDHDLPEFPLCIELYGDKLYVAEYKRRHGLSEEEHDAWMEDSLQIAAEVLGVNREDVFLKLRQRKPGRLGQYQKKEGGLQEFVVQENGLQFIVNLSDYLDTGLFFDHRLTRQKAREMAAGKKVLNLFAYTGSFSVYTAAGGAATVTTVDLSNTYLQWARRNMELNGFMDPGRFQYAQADVIAWLKEAESCSYDLVVMDPPTFSNSKRMEGILDVQRDHAALIRECLRLLTPGGVLIFSTNYRKFILDQAALPPCEIKDITRATTPFDFEGRFARYCFLIKNPELP